MTLGVGVFGRENRVARIEIQSVRYTHVPKRRTSYASGSWADNMEVDPSEEPDHDSLVQYPSGEKQHQWTQKLRK